MTKPGFQIDAILLAAGSSSRFGSDKRSYPVNGVPMLQRTLGVLVDAVRSVTVVLKQCDRDILPQLLGEFSNDPRVLPLLLDHPAAGIGSNLALAVAHLPAECAGVLVMLADMPYVQSQTVQAVADSFNVGKIIAPVFSGDDGNEQRGHPVLFARQFFQELELLTGDSGARSVLQRHADSILYLPVPDAGILRDIDVLPV
jgi:molybdenum cofactor cytidylyltransferase